MHHLHPISEEEMVATFLQIELASSRFESTILAILKRDGRDRGVIEVPDLGSAPDNYYRGVVPHTSPWLSADISPAVAAQKGDLFYMEVEQCSGAVGTGITSSSGTLDWTIDYNYRHGAYHLQVDCPHPLEWHVVAGWLNQPVTYINYVKRWY